MKGQNSQNNFWSRHIEKALRLSCIISAIIIILLIIFITYPSIPVLQKEGLSYFLNSTWSYSDQQYGIAIFIISTTVVTLFSLSFACPLGIFSAIYLSEYAPKILSGILRPTIDLLVGIPSVVYGLFGIFIVEGYIRHYVKPFLTQNFSYIPFFADKTPHTGESILLASFILAIMIIPTIVALSQESLRALPSELRENSMALGATKWETIRHILLPAAKIGIFGSIILALMRAMGETMALVMLAGNIPIIPTSVFDRTITMTSKIVLELPFYIAFEEERSALFGIAATLFLMEFFFILGFRFLVLKSKRRA